MFAIVSISNLAVGRNPIFYSQEVSLFVSLLYHTRWSLSRGFFNFFLTFFFGSGRLPSPYLVHSLYHILTALSRGILNFFLLCSRHNPSLLQRNGSGSHLYTANLHTLRSVHWVEVLLALVGTHISWSPHPPLLCFHYTTHCGICQALFCQSLYFSEKPLT